MKTSLHVTQHRANFKPNRTVRSEKNLNHRRTHGETAGRQTEKGQSNTRPLRPRDTQTNRRQANKQTDRQTTRESDRRVKRRTDGHTDRWINGQIARRTDRQTGNRTELYTVNLLFKE